MKHSLAPMGIVAGLLTGMPAYASYDNWTEAKWLLMIKSELEESSVSKCDVKVAKIISQVIGNNGFRSETWVVEYCAERLKYHVRYCPRSAFAECGKQFEVEKRSDE